MVFTRADWEAEMKRVASSMDEATFQANVMGLFTCFALTIGDGTAVDSAKAKESADTAAAKEKERDAAADEIQLSARAYLEQMRADAAAAKEKERDAAADEIQLSARAFLDQMRSAETTISAPVNRKALLEGVFRLMHKSEGSFDLGAFLAQVKISEAAASVTPLIHFLQSIDSAAGAGGNLYCEQFVTVVLESTPLGYLRNVAFESAVRGLLADLGRVGVDAVSVNDRVDVS